MAEYIPRTAVTGTLRALCEECTTIMNKVVSITALPQLQQQLALTIRQREQHLMDKPQPCLNVSLLKESKVDA